jgi:hypothetical protein
VKVASDKKAALKGELEALQRTFRISPKVERYEVMRVLLDNSYDSAFKISRVRRERFVQEIAQHLPKTDKETSEVRAAWVYDQARQRLQ